MAYSARELRTIYDRTDGRCHICRKKLSLVNYGKLKGRGPWEVDHSHPRVNGGSDRKSNLLPACPSCNRSKGSSNNSSVRDQHGHTRKPLSKSERAAARRWNATGGGAVGAVAGGLLGGPPGFVVGGLLGAALGHNAEVE
ncbi:MAG: HNH endonuclease signature motif containing protein [Myxococcota bacterium]